MKSFLTGVDGFIGTWLTKLLRQRGDSVSGISRRGNLEKEAILKYQGDIQDFSFVSKIVKEENPDRIFHLAAQSNIPRSFANPRETINININGTLNLLEAIRQEKRKIIFLSAGSSAEYGKTTFKNHVLSEESPLLPSSPYAISKAAQGYFAQIYREAYKLEIIHVRPFAIIGPGKTEDAISDFARGIAAIEKDKQKSLLVGNLSRSRDFLDVRDAVLAMDMVTSKKSPYRVYNICSGQRRKLEDILDILTGMAKTKIIIKRDPQKSRPLDDSIIVGNPEKLFSLGFKPKYAIAQTLSEILNYWRKRS